MRPKNQQLDQYAQENYGYEVLAMLSIIDHEMHKQKQVISKYSIILFSIYFI